MLRRSGGANFSAVGSSILPAADNTYDLGGTSAKRWANLYTIFLRSNTWRDLSGNNKIQISGGGNNTYTSDPGDSSSTVAHQFKCTTTLAQNGSKLASWENGGAEKAYITFGGSYVTTGSMYTAGTGVFGQITSNTSVYLQGGVVAGSTNPGIRFGNSAVLTASAGKIAAFYNDTSFATPLLIIRKEGGLTFDATDSSAAPGAATVNKPSGQAAVANGVSSVVITNSMVSTTSVVVAVLQDNTDALYVRSVVPAAGSFTINLSGNTTAARKVGWVVFN